MKRSTPSPTQSRRNFLGCMSAAVGAMSGLGRTIGPMSAIAGVTASARAAAATGVSSSVGLLPGLVAAEE